MVFKPWGFNKHQPPPKKPWIALDFSDSSNLQKDASFQQTSTLQKATCDPLKERSHLPPIHTLNQGCKAVKACKTQLHMSTCAEQLSVVGGFGGNILDLLQLKNAAKAAENGRFFY